MHGEPNWAFESVPRSQTAGLPVMKAKRSHMGLTLK